VVVRRKEKSLRGERCGVEFEMRGSAYRTSTSTGITATAVWKEANVVYRNQHLRDTLFTMVKIRHALEPRVEVLGESD
jgi:hypothetical protein